TISNARGSQHPVQVGTRAFTSAHAIKLITLDDDGFSSSSSVASCRTTTRVKWIRTLRRRLASRLIERIAYRKAEEQRPLAQRIASRRAEKRVATMMDSQTDEMLGRMNTRFRNRFRPTLEQRSVYPRWVRYTTTEKQFNLHALQCQPNQLGAPTDPPPMPKYAFCVQIHESMPANTAASYMGGINLTEAMAAELAEKLTGEVPADLQKEKDWTVKFDLRKPVVLSFRNNQLKIAMTANRFARGNNSLNRTMEISASYDIIQDGEGFVLRRAPEIDVVFPGKAPDELLGPTELARRNLMQDVFASVFGEEFLTDSIRFPERFEKLQDLRLRYISAENGWLSLGFK
ncbi:MAG: hypothetical protein KDB27_17015, partial [Planctomycetales bacterium]|nr:hypothetical protein [Planctomycetales bacterium]